MQIQFIRIDYANVFQCKIKIAIHTVVRASVILLLVSLQSKIGIVISANQSSNGDFFGTSKENTYKKHLGQVLAIMWRLC